MLIILLSMISYRPAAILYSMFDYYPYYPNFCYLVRHTTKVVRI